MAEAQIPTSQNLLANQLLQYGGTQALPVIQRSQYLADALRNLQSSGGQNLRTAGALGSNLLANALLQYSQNKNNQAMLGQVQGGQQRLLNANSLPGENPYGTSGPDPSAIAASAQAASDAGPSGAGLSIGGAVGGSPPVQTSGPNATMASSSPLGSATPPLATALRGGDPTPPPASPQNSTLGHVLAHYTAEGYSPAAASGLAGGFTAESRLDPNATNGAEGAVGIGQWRGPRLDDLKAFAASRGTPLTDLDTQLAFSDKELGGSEGRARTALLGAQTPDQGAAASNMYERPAGYRPGGDPAQVSNWSARDAAAQQAFAQLSHPQSPASGPQIAAAAPPALVSAPPTSAGAAGPAGGQPYQVASLGTPPGPPQGGGGGVPPAGPVAPSPAAGPVPAAPMPQQVAQGVPPPVGSTAWQQAQLQGQGARPMVPPTGLTDQSAQPQANADFRGTPAPLASWQIQHLNALKQNATTPQGFQAFEQYKTALQNQAYTAEEFTETRPNDAGQRIYVGKVSGRQYIDSPAGMVVAAGPKMVTGPGASLTPVANTGDAPVSASAAGAAGYRPGAVVAQNQATGDQTIKQAPFDLEPVARGFINGDNYSTLNKTARAINSMQRILANTRSNNGVADMGTFDNALQTETGLSAKVGTAKLLSEAFDLPTEASLFIQHAVGPGSMTPQVLGQMINATRSYDQGQRAIAQHELNDANGRVQKESNGAYKDIGVTLPGIDPLPNVPWMGTQNPANPGSAAAPAPPSAPPGPTPGHLSAAQIAAKYGADPIGAARAAIASGKNRAAVIQRMQADGINTSGL